MRNTRNAARTVVASIGAGLLLTLAVAAQERRSGGGGGPAYDLSAETTVKATVSRQYEIQAGPDRKMGILAVAVDGKPLQLILAPPEFLAKERVDVKAGDTIDVTGVAGFRVNGEPAMMTRQLKIGNRTIALRDATGQPAWGGVSAR